MPLRKIKDYNKASICMSPEHNPPMHIVLEAGEYVYTCPVCGKETRINVPLITC